MQSLETDVISFEHQLEEKGNLLTASKTSLNISLEEIKTNCEAVQVMQEQAQSLESGMT